MPVSNGDNAPSAEKRNMEVTQNVDQASKGNGLAASQGTQQVGQGPGPADQLTQDAEHGTPQVVKTGGPVLPSGLLKRPSTKSAPAQSDCTDGYGDLDLDLEDDELWMDARENKLIELYRDCPFLWNKTLSSYQLRNKQEVSYAKFAEVLGVMSS